ncbi:MAG: GTP-binding protein, partial [Gammaproteobacteria bacterium]|nr:GTP-binding protein [Gammaproteobacteria bacterium]
RVTADAAAVGLALKTGGIGLNDFLLAPAMLSVTSMLTESALGRYIDRVKAKLRIEQLDAVKSQLLEGYLKTSLLQLAEQSGASAQSTITEQALQKARSLLSNSRAE